MVSGSHWWSLRAFAVVTQRPPSFVFGIFTCAEGSTDDRAAANEILRASARLTLKSLVRTMTGLG